MREVESLPIALVVIAIIGLTLYVPFVLLNRFVFLFIDPRRDWVHVLRRSIGPAIPPHGAIRSALLYAARQWLYLILLGLLGLLIETLLITLLASFSAAATGFVLFLLTATFIFIGVVDLAILLTRCLLPRRGLFGRQRTMAKRAAVKRPPNYALHPPPGGGVLSIAGSR